MYVCLVTLLDYATKWLSKAKAHFTGNLFFGIKLKSMCSVVITES